MPPNPSQVLGMAYYDVPRSYRSTAAFYIAGSVDRGAQRLKQSSATLRLDLVYIQKAGTTGATIAPRAIQHGATTSSMRNTTTLAQVKKNSHSADTI